jgi:hypothetical protein
MLKHSSRVMCYPVTSCSHTSESVRASTVGSAVNSLCTYQSLDSWLAFLQPPPYTINCCLRPRAYLDSRKEILSATLLKKRIIWINWNHCHFFFQKLHALDILHYTFIQSKSKNYVGKTSLCLIKQSFWAQLKYAHPEFINNINISVKIILICYCHY